MKTVDEAPKGVKIGMADWKESISEVLKTIDKQLKEFGLEVVEVDNGSDTYEWYIQKRAK